MGSLDDEFQPFWSLFRARAPELARSESADSAAYDEIVGRLHTIDPRLYLEFSTDDAECELIVRDRRREGAG